MPQFEPRRAKAPDHTITYIAAGGKRRSMRASEGATGPVFTPRNADEAAAADLFGLPVARKEQQAAKPSDEKEK